MSPIRINLYGKEIEVVASTTGWTVFYRGDEGKKRLATDVTIPAEVAESELLLYLADIYHEFATGRYPKPSLIKPDK